MWTNLSAQLEANESDQIYKLVKNTLSCKPNIKGEAYLGSDTFSIGNDSISIVGKKISSVFFWKKIGLRNRSFNIDELFYKLENLGYNCVFEGDGDEVFTFKKHIDQA